MAKQQRQQWYQRSSAQSILAVVSIAVFSIIGAFYLQSSHAAAARCYQAIVAPSGVGSCAHYPVTTGGYPKADKCYKLIINSTGSSFVYKPQNCSAPPFKAKACYQAIVSPAGIGPCQHYPVTTGGYPQIGKCYILTLNAAKTSYVYKPADCSRPPFNT